MSLGLGVEVLYGSLDEVATTSPRYYEGRVITAAEAVGTGPPKRIPAGIKWLDNVLGGGFAAGSVVMVHGEPGSGKSTSLMQAASNVPDSLYISSEESALSLGQCALRLKLRGNLHLLETNNLGEALRAADGRSLIVVDSIQRMRGKATDTITVLADFAKRTGTCVVVTCHETKSGRYAGPGSIEHDVDVSVKISRQNRSVVAEKNRFGPTGIKFPIVMTNEGVFDPQSQPSSSSALPPKKKVSPITVFFVIYIVATSLILAIALSGGHGSHGSSSSVSRLR
jgi:DNA repair protein RadA/Sms